MSDTQDEILSRNLARDNRTATINQYLIDTDDEDTVIRIRRGSLRFCGNVKFAKGDAVMIKIRDALMALYPKDWEESRGHMEIDP